MLFRSEPINAPRVGKDQIARLYRNFVKFGVGYPWTPYLDFEFNSLRSTKWAYGARAFHHSSWGKIKNYAPSSFSDSKIEGYAQRFFKKDFTLNAKAGYEHTMVQYYGYQLDTIFGSETEFDNMPKGKDIRRNYHHIYTEINFSNNDIYKSKLNQDYTINYDYLAGRKYYPLIDEHQLGFLGALNHDIRMKRFASFNVGGEIGVNYFNNRGGVFVFPDSAVPTTHNILLNVNPHVTFKYKEYYFKAGFDLVFHFGEKTRIYPDIDFRLHIVPEIFTLYAGMDGGYERNSILSLMKENPFLSFVPDIGFRDKKFNIFAGVQLGLSRSLSIGARGSFGVYDGMPVFFNDALELRNQYGTFLGYSSNAFSVLEERVNLFNAHFDLKYQLKNMLWLTFNADYNHYAIPSSSDLLRVWYKPVFVTGLDIEYLLLEKFKFGLDFYIQAGAKRPDFLANGNIDVESMKAVFDFNFNFEYIWSKRLSFFLDVNNFAYQQNFYYYNYPTQRINVLLGVTYNFGGERVTGK